MWRVVIARVLTGAENGSPDVNHDPCDPENSDIWPMTHGLRIQILLTNIDVVG